jgi:Tol biopolymer transport system component
VQGWIAFGSGDGIIATDPDEGPNDTRRIVFRGSGAGTPIPVAWSPDGTRLLFDNGDGLRVVDGEGRQTRLTSSPGSSASWSPDGSQVAFVDASGLQVVPSKGGESLLLVPAMRSSLSGAAWSPDGRWIAFLEYSRGRPTLKKIDITTGSVSRVIGLPRWEIYRLAWSPDGSGLLLGTCMGKFSCDIVVVDVGTGRVTPLTDDHVSNWPTWSPDGTRIAFVRAGFLFVMKADGTDARVAASFASGPLAWMPGSPS